MPLNFVTTWETPKGNKNVITNDVLIVGDQITNQFIRKSVTATLNQVLPQSINLGARKVLNYLKVCARLFQRLVARTPMDETYKYLRLFDDDGNLRPHYEVHKPDNDSVRKDWQMIINIGGSYIIAKATDFDMKIFNVIDDNQAVKIIYNFIKSKIDYKKIKINITREGLDTNLSLKFSNNNSHFNKLEYGGYQKDSWHKPYKGNLYYHGVNNGFSVMAPAGFYRKTMAEKEEAFKISEDKGIIITQALKRHCIKEVSEAEMKKHYDNITIAGYKSISELTRDNVNTDFKKMNINNLYEYAIKEMSIVDELEIAKNIPTSNDKEFMDYIFENYDEPIKVIEQLLSKYGIVEDDVLKSASKYWDKILSGLENGTDNITEEVYYDELDSLMWRAWGTHVRGSNRKVLTKTGVELSKKEMVKKLEKKRSDWYFKGRLKYLTPEAKKRIKNFNEKRKAAKKEMKQESNSQPKASTNIKNTDKKRKIIVKRRVNK